MEATSDDRRTRFPGLEDMPCSVLVVDDHRDVLEATVALLSMMGYCVYSADCGEAALRILRRVSSIEVLLTDVVMPRMDGLTLAHHAKRVCPHIKVILVSGYVSPDLHTPISGSDFRVLAKPFKMPDLSRMMRS